MKSPTHLNALRAFEATARLGGYAPAAGEIGVTPEAVGQLVRSLEAYLGIKLFHRGRSGRRLVPTQEALTVLPNLSDAFKMLVGATDRLKAFSQSGVLTVSVAPSIAAKWLMPRLPSFIGAETGIDVRLDITDRLVDIAIGEADVAIRYGRGEWPDINVETLFLDEKLFPVCSPALLEKMPALQSPNALPDQVLIRDATITNPAYPTWRDWFRHAGLMGDEKAQFIEFNASLLTIEAAVMGQGVALVREHLVKDELAFGKLIRLFPTLELSTGWNYYVVTSAQSCNRARIFADWLIKQAKSLS